MFRANMFIFAVIFYPLRTEVHSIIDSLSYLFWELLLHFSGDFLYLGECCQYRRNEKWCVIQKIYSPRDVVGLFPVKYSAIATVPIENSPILKNYLQIHQGPFFFVFLKSFCFLQICTLSSKMALFMFLASRSGVIESSFP